MHQRVALIPSNLCVVLELIEMNLIYFLSSVYTFAPWCPRILNYSPATTHLLLNLHSFSLSSDISSMALGCWFLWVGRWNRATACKRWPRLAEPLCGARWGFRISNPQYYTTALISIFFINRVTNISSLMHKRSSVHNRGFQSEVWESWRGGCGERDMRRKETGACWCSQNLSENSDSFSGSELRHDKHVFRFNFQYYYQRPSWINIQKSAKKS